MVSPEKYMALGLPSVVPKDGAVMIKPVTSPPGRCSQGVPVTSKRLPPISRGRVSLWGVGHDGQKKKGMVLVEGLPTRA